jgi:hypothetical protein
VESREWERMRGKVREVRLKRRTIISTRPSRDRGRPLIKEGATLGRHDPRPHDLRVGVVR